VIFMEWILIFGIAVALCYNFINGLHDAANSIATVVATRVLSPVKAIILAAFFNLLGPLILTTAIAETISRGVFIPEYLTLEIVIIGVICASFWTLFTAYVGLPVSSVHSLVGGLVGSAVAYGGLSVVILPSLSVIGQIIGLAIIGMSGGAGVIYLLACYFKEQNPRQYVPIGAFFGFILIIPAAIALHYLVISGILKIILFIIISPCLGFFIAFLLGSLVTRFFRNSNTSTMNGIFNKLQIISASFFSLGHGSNDGQNAMGVITTMLVLAGVISDYTVPLWVILACSGAISLGTLTGGWKIVQTMAKKITHLQPYQGFCAETGGGIVLLFVSIFGIPVSTTHAISGCVMGVGSVRGTAAVQWSMVRQIVTAWVITIPLTALVGFAVCSMYLAILGR